MKQHVVPARSQHTFVGAMRPRCVLHVGPHKTGTSSVQDALSLHTALLLKDGWHQPGGNQIASYGKHNSMGPKNLANLAFFLRRPPRAINTSEPVWRSFETWIQKHAANSRDVVLSAEELSRPSVGNNIELLASVLSPFRTTIVVGYRPFYEFLISYHKQFFRRGPPLARYMQGLNPRGWAGLTELFTLRVVQRYARYFDDIHIVPLDEGYMEAWMCSAFLSAPHTCSYVREHPPPKKNVRFKTNQKTPSVVPSCQDECTRQEDHEHVLAITSDAARNLASLVRTRRISWDSTRSVAPSVNSTAFRMALAKRAFCSCVPNTK